MSKDKIEVGDTVQIHDDIIGVVTYTYATKPYADIWVEDHNVVLPIDVLKLIKKGEKK